MKWFARLKSLVVQQLKQGATPEKLAWSVAWGMVLSIFPVFGVTTLLCFLVASYAKLNQPIIQAANYSMTAIQILSLPLFLRTGERFFGLQNFPFDPRKLVGDFMNNPADVFAQGGASTLAGIAVWCVVAFPLAFVIHKIFFPIFKRALRKKESL